MAIILIIIVTSIFIGLWLVGGLLFPPTNDTQQLDPPIVSPTPPGIITEPPPEIDPPIAPTPHFNATD